LLQECSNVAAGMQQCWNIYHCVAVYKIGSYCDVTESFRANGASSLNLEKFRYGRKHVESFVHLFLAFPDRIVKNTIPRLFTISSK